MRLVILGAGGYGRTVADVARQSGRYEEIIFLDDDKKTTEIKGCCSEYMKLVDRDTEMYPAFGNNKIRMEWIKKLEKARIPIMTLIHPLAYVSPRARVEKGVVILPYAIVNTDCIVKKGCIIDCSAVVDHDCILEAGVHVAPGGIVRAENRIPEMLKVDSADVISERQYHL